MIPTIAQTAQLTMIRIVMGNRTYAGRRLRKGVFLCRQEIGSTSTRNLPDHFPSGDWGGGVSTLGGRVVSTSPDGRDRCSVRGESSASNSTSKGSFTDIWPLDTSPFRSRLMSQWVLRVRRSRLEHRRSATRELVINVDQILKIDQSHAVPPGTRRAVGWATSRFKVGLWVSNWCEWVISRGFKG